MDMLFFASDAKLRLEFSQLFASLFKNPEPYVRIVNALGSQSAEHNTKGTARCRPFRRLNYRVAITRHRRRLRRRRYCYWTIQYACYKYTPTRQRYYPS